MALPSTPEPHAHAQRARTQAVVFGVLSVAAATLTAAVAWWAVSSYEADTSRIAAGDADEVVVVAAHELRAGAVLAPEDLELAPRPAGVPVASTFQNPESLIGKTVRDVTLPGEALRAERLTTGGHELRLDQVIDPGTRAVTIRANHASAVGGLLRPGFFVDVIVTIRPDTADLAADWVTETILQGVRIIAVNDSVSSTPTMVEGAQDRVDSRDIFVTLEVQPEESEELALATSRGQLHLALRAQNDFDMLPVGRPLVANALVGLPVPVAEAQRQRLERKRTVARLAAPTITPPRPESTDVIRGGAVTTEQFDDQGRRIPRTGR